MHLLFSCKTVKLTWEFIQGIVDIPIKLDEKNIVLNRCTEQTNDAINFIVLLTKYLIFQQKCFGKKPKKQYVRE